MYTSCSRHRAVTFFCFAKRKVTKEKAAPTIVPAFTKARLGCDAQKIAEREKLASLRQFSVLIAFFLRFSGTIHRGDPLDN
jgi:hypothetical protein